MMGYWKYLKKESWFFNGGLLDFLFILIPYFIFAGIGSIAFILFDMESLGLALIVVGIVLTFVWNSFIEYSEQNPINR